MKGCRPLNDGEIASVLDLLRGRNSRLAMRDRCFALVGMNTGFRVSELLSLRVGDVVQDGRVLERVLVERRNMKGKRSSRDVELNDVARAALKAWLPVLYDWRGAGADLFLFQSTKGGRLTRRQAGRIISMFARELSMPPRVATHSLRKTFGDRVYQFSLDNWRPGLELPVRVAMKALGHSHVETTERYLGLDVQAVDKAVRAINVGARARVGGAG